VNPTRANEILGLSSARSVASELVGGRVASGPPVRDERRVLVGGVLPREVPRVEDGEFARGQPFEEKLRVDQGTT
jgi:hypothetical protein